MSLLALVHFLTCLCYIGMIIFVLCKNPKALLNRILAVLLLCFVIWSFGAIFYSDPRFSKEIVRLAIYINSIGWLSFASLAFWFMLIFAKKEKILKSKITYIFIFLPPLIFHYQVWRGRFQVDFIRQPWGWNYVWSDSLWLKIFYVYYLFLMVFGGYLTYDFSCKSGRLRYRKQARVNLSAIFISLILGTVSNVLLQELHIYHLPPLADVFALIFAGAFVYTITRYSFLAISPETAADNILATMGESLLLIEPDNNIVNANQTTFDLLGYKKEDLVGKPVTTIFPEGEYDQRIKELKEKGTIHNYDTFYRTRTGEEIPVSIFMSLLKDEYGDLSGILCIAEDMREIKRLMEKEKDLAAATAAAEVEKKRAAELEKAYKDLRDTQAQLVQSAKMAGIGQLSAGVAHEINNPLGGILGYAQFILTKLDKPDFNAESFKTCREYLTHIERESQRCKKIVENLLNFSRKSADVFQPVDIKTTMENTLSVIRHSLESKNIKITTEYEPDIPLIKGNANQLQQVFTNIIINAQHAMPKGGQLNIRIKVGEEGGKKNLQISFQDTGCGIPKENLERIFEPFFTTKGGDWKSIGLGLSICYQIIEQHKGRILVESEVNKGSTFTFVLPYEI